MLTPLVDLVAWNELTDRAVGEVLFHLPGVALSSSFSTTSPLGVAL